MRRKVFSAKLSPKGQITIPADVIRRMGWLKGRTRLYLGRVGNALVITPDEPAGARTT
jgi:bifunctional DNA-binding transcriptional regulator/antitoxin component of YhaV-PrlF toxin-antitoxin module